MSPKSKKLTFLDHLKELRVRLIRASAAVIIVFISLVYFSNDIYLFVADPLQALLFNDSFMIATEVASPFLSPLKLTFYVSIFLAFPYVLYEIWSFIAPGMYKNEKNFFLLILFISTMLFYLGIFFAYLVVFPLVFGFFTNVGPENITVMTDISKYLDFVLNLFLAFALAFEIPVLILILNFTGITTPESLAKKRPYVIVACFVLGMILTPPDVISQILLALPAWLLFETGLLFSRIYNKKNTETKE